MLQGSVSDFSLADILHLISLQQKTGMLEIRGQDGEARVYFDQGHIVYARSSQVEDFRLLGQILIQRGHLQPEALDRALQAQSQNPGPRIGQILVEQGAATQDAVLEALQAQVKEVLFHLFLWQEGAYTFHPMELPLELQGLWPLPTDFLLMEALRMADEWPLIRKEIPHNRVIYARTVPLEAVESLELDPEEREVFQALEKALPVEDLLRRVSLGTFETCRILVHLRMLGLVQEVGEATAESTSASHPRSLGEWIRKPATAWFVLGILVLMVGAAWWTHPWIASQEVILPQIFQEGIQVQNRAHLEWALEAYHRAHGQWPRNWEALLQEGWISPETLRLPEGGAWRLEPTGQRPRIQVWKGRQGDQLTESFFSEPEILTEE